MSAVIDLETKSGEVSAIPMNDVEIALLASEPSEMSSEVLEADNPTDPHAIALPDFLQRFGSGLLDAVRAQNPPLYVGQQNAQRHAVMEGLKRQPFPAQREVVQSMAKLLLDENQPAGVINAEMGTGKTMMAIALAAVMHDEGIKRCLVISPPHLVYKWRREIRNTVPNARVWVLNGPDTLKQLLTLRGFTAPPSVPEFFVMGRVRMRMGYQWRPAYMTRYLREADDRPLMRVAACASCGTPIVHVDEKGNETPLSPMQAEVPLNERQARCRSCGDALWTLILKRTDAKSKSDRLADALQQLPTIGNKTAQRLITRFGVEMLSGMLEDNVHEFINLLDENGELVFSDRQAARMERAMSNMAFSFGQGGYQPTEFIKRYLPQGFFGLLVVDEGHEYKNEGSAQGQAMGVLARKCQKTLLLTGTLMGGYADDLFYLLMRLNPTMMIEDGYYYNQKKSLATAALSFMRSHGVLKDIYKNKDGPTTSHRTAKGKAITHRTSRGPGFGPYGIMRYVLPYTAFLKLKDIGGQVLPPYTEHFTDVAMTKPQQDAHVLLSERLKRQLSESLCKGDMSLLGVVLNVLLAWPDCCFRDELVRHPHTRAQLAYVPALFGDSDIMPKEAELLRICLAEKARGRKVLVYTAYTGTRDTTSRLKVLLEQSGFKAAVLRASVEADRREDWVLEQVDRGVDVLITNPELVKTGLDMLEFPTIVFMQLAHNAYTVRQAARRSWRIGQKQPVDVYYLGYAQTAQIGCLKLMAKKIAVSQSTSGEMPDSGLDILNQDGDSIEIALAKQLMV